MRALRTIVVVELREVRVGTQSSNGINLVNPANNICMNRMVAHVGRFKHQVPSYLIGDIERPLKAVRLGKITRNDGSRDRAPSAFNERENSFVCGGVSNVESLRFDPAEGHAVRFIDRVLDQLYRSTEVIVGTSEFASAPANDDLRGD